MKSLFTLLLATFFVVAHTFDDETPKNIDRNADPFHHAGEFGGLNLNPGLKIRLAQGVSTMFRDNLADYGRSYLNSDFKLKDHNAWGINWWPLVLRFSYEHLQHAPIQIDMQNFTFNYTHMSSDGTPVVFMEIPLIKDWSYEMDYKMQLGLLPLGGHMSINVSNAIALATVEMKAKSDGVLYPHLHDVYVDFGDSELYCDGWLKQFMFRQNFHFIKYVLMDSINRFGKQLYNTILPNFWSSRTNNMYKTFSMGIPQLNKTGEFNLDYRLTANPLIHNNVMDLDFFFDIGPKLNHCTMKHEEFNYKFEHFDDNYLQMVLSDRVPNCVLDAMAKQGFFEYKINSEWMSKHLGTKLFPVTTKQFAGAFPSLQELYGPDHELDLEVKIMHPRVLFGPSTGENVHFQFELRYGIKELGSMNYIIYDTLHVETAFDMEISEEVLLANIQTMSIGKGGEPRDRKLPIYSDTDFTEEQYEEFWEYMNYRSEQWFSFLNEDIFGAGVPLPYWKMSFLTKLSFHPRAMSAVVSLFYN